MSFVVFTVRSTTETVGVGTRNDIPVSLPFTSGQTSATARAAPETSEDGVLPLAELEKRYIMRALQQTGQNRTHAAKLLGISVRTLRNKIRLYSTDGIDVPAHVD